MLEVNHVSWVEGGTHKWFSIERSTRINVRSESWVMGGGGTHKCFGAEVNHG